MEIQFLVLRDRHSGTGKAFSSSCTTGSMLFLVLSQRSSDQLTELLAKGCQLLDLRTAGEYSNKIAKSALNIPLAELHQRVGELDK